MPSIHLIEGPVGAGKSTYAQKLSRQHEAAHLDLDEWMVTLFSPDRPDTDFMLWYNTCKGRCIEQIWLVSNAMLDVGQSVVLELGLVTLADREDFYRRVDVADVDLHVVVLDVPKEERYRRVQKRNAEASGTFKMAVSDEIFEMANSAWQPPGDTESAEHDIEWVST